MPDFIFVMIAHIYDDSAFLLHQLIHLRGIYIPAFALHREVFIFNAIGYNFIAHFYLQYPKRFAIIIHCNVQSNAI